MNKKNKSVLITAGITLSIVGYCTSLFLFPDIVIPATLVCFLVFVVCLIYELVYSRW